MHTATHTQRAMCASTAGANTAHGQGIENSHLDLGKLVAKDVDTFATDLDSVTFVNLSGVMAGEAWTLLIVIK